ncbi:MAG: ribosome maturation factor RimM [Myxococcota bacterium]|nr:ribosome maturation factor RimM [Myxococcota bacterium]
MVSSDCTNRFVEIGVIGKPHGIRGEVNIFVYNPESDLTAYKDLLFVKAGDDIHPIACLDCRPSPRGYRVVFGGISTREDAARLKGAVICVRRDALPRLLPDEFYVADLIGLEVMDGDALLGRVVSSREQGGVEVITVESETVQVTVPLVDEFVEKIDIAGGRITLCNTDDFPRSPIRRRS